MTIFLAITLGVAALFSAWYVSTARARARRPAKTATALDLALHQLIDEVSREAPLARAPRGTPHRHLDARPQNAADDDPPGPRPQAGPIAGHGLFH